MTMQRSKITPIQQPDDLTCGPTSLKLAAQMLGKKKSLKTFVKLCKTNKNGTSTINMVRASNRLGFPVLVVEYASVRHIQSALRQSKGGSRAVLVTYLYDRDRDYNPDVESGHWAMVASYSASKGRIVLFDSSTGQRKSYNWQYFRDQWFDYDFKRRSVHKRGRHFRLTRKWCTQLMMVIATDISDLPKFRIRTQKIYAPARMME